jgi:hypothetical protein
METIKINSRINLLIHIILQVWKKKMDIITTDIKRVRKIRRYLPRWPRELLAYV